MYGGIDQLVNTFKGNPQPLAQKVQRDQQGQPPGAIPPDLEAALALQQIAELRQGAQNQQAMQAGGAQPTVVQKLHQMLGAQQAQAQAPQMQGQPVMAASGGSITQLMSNLGQNYAGGGIVAFDGTTGSAVKDPNKESSSQFVQDISTLPQKFDEMKQRAREEDAVRAEQDRRMAQYQQDKLAAQQKTSLFNYLFGSPEREKEGQAKLAELSNAPVTSAATPAAADAETEKIKRLAAARAQTGQSANPALAPKPPVVNVPPAAPRPSIAKIAAPEKPAAVDPNSLRALSEKYIREEMGLNPETESEKMVARARKMMGLDELLKEKEGRAAAKEKYIEEMKAKRAPLWIDALMSANKPARGGIAGVLQNMAVGASAARQNYEAEDLRYIDELNRLRDVITDAKITGNKELAKEALAAFKETDARRKAALTSATSLLNVDEQTATRKEIAKGNAAAAAAARENATAQRNMANAISAVKNDEVINRLQKRAEELGKMPTQANRTAADDIMRQIEARQNAIYKAFKVLQDVDTMPAAPGAGSPGGTRPPLSSFQR
jgi:hypothetical protein